MKVRHTRSGSEYVVVCFSMYPADVERADWIVQLLRDAGESDVSRSSVVREALKLYARSLARSGQPRGLPAETTSSATTRDE